MSRGEFQLRMGLTPRILEALSKFAETSRRGIGSIGSNETRGGPRRSYSLEAATPSFFSRAATSAPALCVLTLLSM